MITKIICCFANPWAFQAKTPDAAKHESLRQMAGRNKIHWLK
jgi:hypothetical protein